jgi:ribosomal protein L11 methyltransferase
LKSPVYIEINIPFTDVEKAQIIEALLAEMGFESFVMDESMLQAYIQEQQFFKEEIEKLLQNLEVNDFYYKRIEPENWNAVWESNFQPIEVDGQIRVRASFHDSNTKYPIEIIIEPKMSFGTGHHATTWQVMKHMLDLDFQGKNVLDFGAGTGILSILAKKLGAATVVAVDNDPQCIENAFENFARNRTPEIQLIAGDIRIIGDKDFDVVIGNITRNTILEYLPEIAAKTRQRGFFIASGFYLSDLELIINPAAGFELKFISSLNKDNWCAALFQKEIF